MKHKEDLRITKTKAALVKAFFGMLDTMEMDDITVNDLCISAGIRRATFYKHFNDKNDFLSFLIRSVREEFDDSIRTQKRTMTTKEYHISYVSTLISFFMQYEVAMVKILKSPMRAMVIDIFSEQNYQDTRLKLLESERTGAHLPASAEVVAAMLTGGVAENIVRWFESDDRKPIETLKAEISGFIDHIFS